MTATIAACSLLAACAVAGDALIRRARVQLVGLAANDLRLCAGPPDHTVKGDGDAQFWSYDRKDSSGEVTINTLWMGLNVTRQKECRAVFELAKGRVQRIAFTRASGSTTAPLSACVPLVQECADMVAQGRADMADPHMDGGRTEAEASSVP